MRLTRHPDSNFMADRLGGGDTEGIEVKNADDSMFGVVASRMGCNDLKDSDGYHVFQCQICMWPVNSLPKPCSAERHEHFYDARRGEPTPTESESTDGE